MPSISDVFSKVDKIEGWFNHGQAEAIWPHLLNLPKNPLIVEIGTYRGRSTLFFALSRPDALVLTIDICKQYPVGVKIPDSIDPAVVKQGNVFQVAGDSNEVVKRFNWPIDLLFIDSRHLYDTTVEDIKAWTPYIKPGGLALFHDYTPDTDQLPGFPGVVKAVDEWLLDNPQFARLDISYQLALAQRRHNV